MGKIFQTLCLFAMLSVFAIACGGNKKNGECCLADNECRSEVCVCLSACKPGICGTEEEAATTVCTADCDPMECP